MRVGILGSGVVGQVLGAGFLKHGHAVVLGTRSPAKLAEWAAQNPKGRVGSFPTQQSMGNSWCSQSRAALWPTRCARPG